MASQPSPLLDKPQQARLEDILAQDLDEFVIDESNNREELDKLLRQADSLSLPTTANSGSPLPDDELFATGDRRAELDLLLRQADTLAAATTPESEQPRKLEPLIVSGAAASSSAPAAAPPVDSVPAAEAAEHRVLSAGRRRFPSSMGVLRRLAASAGSSTNDGDASMLRVESLEAFAAEMAAHLDRGRPVAICMQPAGDHVAVGTSHGHVLIYHRKQDTLQSLLLASAQRPSASVTGSLASSFFGSLSSSSSSSNKHYGGGGGGGGTGAVDPISALQLSESSGLLLAGHASGRLVLWDTVASTILKETIELHHQPIAHIRFLHPSKPHALTVDASGVAHIATFSKVLMAYSVTRQCLLDGSAGVVTAAELLYGHGVVASSSSSSDQSSPVEAATTTTAEPASSSADGSSTSSGDGASVAMTASVIALCTPKVGFVIRIHPKVQLLQRLKVPEGGSGATNLSPRLAWIDAAPVIQTPEEPGAGTLLWCPMLAIAWGSQLQLFRLVRPSSSSSSSSSTSESSNKGEARLVTVGVINCGNSICGLAWLSSGVLLALDVTLRVQAIDTSLKALEARQLPLVTSSVTDTADAMPVTASTASASRLISTAFPQTSSQADLAESITFDVAATSSSSTDDLSNNSSSQSGFRRSIANALAEDPASAFRPSALCTDGTSIYLIGGHATRCPLLRVRAVSWVEWLSEVASNGEHLRVFESACELFGDADDGTRRSSIVPPLPLAPQIPMATSGSGSGEPPPSKWHGGSAAGVRDAVGNLISQLLPQFSERHLQDSGNNFTIGLQPSSTQLTLEPITLAHLCVEVCVSLRLFECLYGPLFTLFTSENGDPLTRRKALISSLEPYIVARRIPFLPAPVLLSICQHFASSCGEEDEEVGGMNEPPGVLSSAIPQRGGDWRSRLEACLLSLDASATPLPPLLAATRRLHLYSAYTRACNLSVSDYSAPIEALLAAMNGELAPLPSALLVQPIDRDAMDSSLEHINKLPTPPPLDNDGKRAVGYKLLLYLRHCLTGYTFPTGEAMPNPNDIIRARVQACSYLYDQGSPGRLTQLLSLDATASIDVLALAFDNAARAEGAEEDSYEKTMPSLERMLTSLDTAVFDGSSLASPAAEGGAEAARRHFVRVVIEMHLSLTSSATAAVPPAVLLRAATSLAAHAAAARESDDGDERLLTRMVRESRHTKHDLPASLLASLLELSENGQLPRVCAAIHLRNGHPAKALSTCLADPLGGKGCYSDAVPIAMEGVARASGATTTTLEAARDALKELIVKKLQQLDGIDRHAAVILLRRAFDGEHESLVTRLKETPLLQLEYLRSLVPIRDGTTAKQLAIGSSTLVDQALAPPAAEPPTSAAPDGDGDDNNGMPPPMEHLPEFMHGLYVELLCTHSSPSDVRGYLELHDGYRLDTTLECTLMAGCDEASSYLLERTGDVKGALDLSLKALKSSLEQMLRRSSASDLKGLELLEEEVEGITDRVSGLCARCGVSSVGSKSSSQKMWLLLFDTVVEWQLHAARRTAQLPPPPPFASSPTPSRRGPPGGGQGPDAAKMRSEYLRSFAQRLAMRIANHMAWSGHGHNGLASHLSSGIALRHLFETHTQATLSDLSPLIIDALHQGEVDQEVLRAAHETSSADKVQLLQQRHKAIVRGHGVRINRGASTAAAAVASTNAPAQRHDAARRLALLARSHAIEEARTAPSAAAITEQKAEGGGGAKPGSTSSRDTLGFSSPNLFGRRKEGGFGLASALRGPWRKETEAKAEEKKVVPARLPGAAMGRPEITGEIIL